MADAVQALGLLMANRARVTWRNVSTRVLWFCGASWLPRRMARASWRRRSGKAAGASSTKAARRVRSWSSARAPGGFRGLRWPWHWRSSGPGNAARRAALAAVAPEASSERCRAVHGHRAGSWRFGSGHVQDVELKLRQQSCGQCQLNGRLFAGQVALALLQGDHRPAQGGHDLPVVQLAALDTQRRHLVVAPGSPPVGRYRRPRGLGG